MKTSVLSALTLVAFLAASSPAAAKTITQADGSCALHVSDEKATSFTWDGACVDGFVSGDGSLVVLGDDGIVAAHEVGAKHGYVLLDGGNTTRITVDPTTFRRVRIDCYDKLPAGGRVAVLVPPELDTANKMVRKAIYEPLVEDIKAECIAESDRHRRSAFRVIVRLDGVEYPSPDSYEFVMVQDHFGVNFRDIGGKWQRENEWAKAYDLEFVAAREAAEQAERERLHEEKRRQREEEVRAAALERAQAKTAAEDMARQRIAASRALYEDLAKNFRIDQLVLDSSTSANPFQYDGKRIAVNAVFHEMVGRDEGLYLVNGELAILRGMAFNSGGEPLVAVITNLDKQERIVPQFGNRLILVGEIAAAHSCVSARCDEVLEWVRQ